MFEEKVEGISIGRALGFFQDAEPCSFSWCERPATEQHEGSDYCSSHYEAVSADTQGSAVRGGGPRVRNIAYNRDLQREAFKKWFAKKRGLSL